MPTAIFHLPELRSHDAEAPLEQALRDTAGVYGAVANHQDRCLEVDFEDDEIGLDGLIAAAAAAGYEARLVG